ncbi:MAG: aminoacetone oxidase family FAD-binding enzyme, partial [Clostridia bacterium]|nr:aminoacetone oxidase family FAD-binding enzyme [Clostridia bacterium]
AYPISRQASSVLDYMRFYLEKNNALIYTNAFVNSIKKDGEEFVVGTVSGATYRSKRVILATGGTASKSFGTDGNGYLLAKKLGHTITELNPALVRLKTDNAVTKTLKNLKALVRATLFDNGKKVKSVVGEVLFTDFGLSGNAIFSLSTYAVRAKNPKISLEFLPNISFDEVVKIIDLRLSLGYINKEDILTGLVQKMIGRAILKNAQDFTAKSLAKSLKNYEFNITGTFGFDNAQVTSGGVDVDFVNPTTMESKVVKDLYLTGEILDVDGDCGGYNLQWAFSSAKTATSDIIKKIGVK